MGLKLIILGTASITLRNIIGFKLGLELFMTPWSVALLLPLDGMLVHRKVTPPPPALCRRYPFIHLGGERQVEQSFLSKERT